MSAYRSRLFRVKWGKAHSFAGSVQKNVCIYEVTIAPFSGVYV